MTDPQTLRDYCAPTTLLQNRVILVTGAGSGLGRAAAMAFARHGATVILTGRSEKKLESVYDEIEHNQYPQPAIFKLNLETAKNEDFPTLAKVIETEFGQLDGLLLNAIQLGARTPLGNYPVKDWNKLLQVNITAPFQLIRALLPLIQRSDDGRILFTESGFAKAGKAYWGAYSVTQGAIQNLRQVLADELETTNVRVNAINPGPVRTSLRATAFPAEDPSTLLSPEAVMNPYLYLMGYEGKNLHGSCWYAQAD